MNLLLDTHVFLWWCSAAENLSRPGLEALISAENDLWLSVASIQEIVIKHTIGKLQLQTALDELIVAQERANALRILPIRREHALYLQRLPAVHADPFDRILIAQAFVEGFTLVSKDERFPEYRVPLLW